MIHSYRHRYALVHGDPAMIEIENLLAQQPDITVPTIAIDGSADGVNAGTKGDKRKFKGPFDYRVVEDAGHNLPQERPSEWARAVLDARSMSTKG